MKGDGGRGEGGGPNLAKPRYCTPYLYSIVTPGLKNKKADHMPCRYERCELFPPKAKAAII